MSDFNNVFKTLFLSSVGAVALTAEKSKGLVDQLIEKGELTVEQGKVLNEELKRNIKQSCDNFTDMSFTKVPIEKVLDNIEELSIEEMKVVSERLKELIIEIENLQEV